MSFALFNMEESRDRRLRRAYTNENLAPGPAEFGKRTLADPIEGAQPYAARCEGLARPDHDLRMFRIEPHDIKRLAVEADAEPTPLTDRIMDHACVAAEQPAIDMDDIAGNSRLRPNPLDEIAVFARGNKTNVLAIGLVGNDEPMAPGNGARFRLLHLAQRKAQNVELRPRGGEEEIALVAAYVLCPEERAAVGAVRLGGDVMAGGEKVGAEILHRVEEIGELDLAIAGDAGNRRLAFGIAAGETVDHLFPEALFIIEHVVRNAELCRNLPGIMNILPGTAGAFAMFRRAVIVKLQRHADHFIALFDEKRSHGRGIDAARHRDDDTRLGGRLRQVEAVAEQGHGAIGLSGKRPQRRVLDI